jgi:hypothetical protein
MQYATKNQSQLLADAANGNQIAQAWLDLEKVLSVLESDDDKLTAYIQFKNTVNEMSGRPKVEDMWGDNYE